MKNYRFRISGFRCLLIFMLMPLASWLTASAEAQTISKTWALSWTDNSNNEEGFFVYRDGSKVGQVSANVVTFNDTVSGAAGQQNCYQVSAFNHAVNADGSQGAIQESAKTAQACGTIPFPPQPAPSAPSGLTLSALSQTQIQASWMDNSTDETGFKLVTQGQAPPRTLIDYPVTNSTSWMIAGLQKNKTYCGTVSAMKGTVESAPSNQSCATTKK